MRGRFCPNLESFLVIGVGLVYSGNLRLNPLADDQKNSPLKAHPTESPSAAPIISWLNYSFLYTICSLVKIFLIN